LMGSQAFPLLNPGPSALAHEEGARRKAIGGNGPARALLPVSL